MSKSAIYPSFTATSLSFLYFLFTKTEGLPFSNDGIDASSGLDHSIPLTSGDNYWIFLSLLSICSVITLIAVLFTCGAGSGCCGVVLPKIYWFGRSGQRHQPTSFDNPVVTEFGLGHGGSSIPLSQIDVRTLELDPVVFEPLPTIQDLSPLSLNQLNTSEDKRHIKGRYLPVSGESQFQSPAIIVPFANEDSELYAHDWFDEPYRNFQRNNLEFIREIGIGWFGEVLEAEAKDIVPFAKKIRVYVKRLKQEASQLDQMRFLDESRIYRDANQGNILKLLGHSIEKLPFLLIMEHCPQGDLKSYLISNVTRAETLSTQGVILNMALDIAKGLEWMGNFGFKHSDLAARNCQVASEGRIVIGDYGLATQMFRDDYYWNSNVPIPLRWAAPETIHCTPTTIQTLKVTTSSNIWTYAVVLWEVTEFAKLPFFELSDEEVISRVLADKNYFLRGPTLPYIPFRDELYQIMMSCWSIDPAQRPAISSIVTKLQILLNNLQSDRKNDEFEYKWERLGARMSSSSSAEFDSRARGAKKSVSFTGIQSLAEQQTLDQEQSLNSTKPEGEMSSEQLLSRTTEQDNIEDDDKWLKEMEEDDDDGCGIAQKVMQKTTSVQDFMVLTHVEPSDLHGPESLTDLTPRQDDDTPTSTEEFSPPSTDPPWPHTNKPEKNDSGTPSSDLSDVLWSPSSSRSTAYPVSDGSRVPTQDSSTLSSQSETSNLNQSRSSENNANSQDAVISNSDTLGNNTPNLTNIDISVTVASPRPESDCDESSMLSNPTENTVLQITSSTTPPNKRRVFFKFDDGDVSLPQNTENLQRPRRHTSTPKRYGSSTSPTPGMNCSNGHIEDAVFETATSTNANMILNETCNLSPISMKRERSAMQSGELVTTIVGLGGYDDLGLEIFQGVTTSQSDNRNVYFNNPEDFVSALPEKYGKVVSSNGKQYFKDNQFGDDNATNEQRQPLSKPASSGSGNNSKGLHSKITTTNGEGNSWDNISSPNGNVYPSTVGSSWDVVSTQDFDSSPESISKSQTVPAKIEIFPLKPANPPDSEVDMDEFWSRQIQSLTTAASDTKSLFAAAGMTLAISPTVDSSDKFMEDINSANQELGSLVMEDLEDDRGTIELVPESHPVEDDVDVKLKFAFVASPAEEEPTTTLSHPSNRTSVEPWIPEEIKETESPPKQEDRGNCFPDDDPGSGPSSLSSCKEFVPSTWNQSLAPVRPAIKSPSTISEVSQQDQKSGLKKSVSFERKKRQVVYEYPPPPLLSDADEDVYGIRNTHNVPTIPVHSSLDWDLTQEELEFAQVNPDDSDDDMVTVHKADPIEMYRISGFDLEDSFKVRPSTEPFNFQSQPPPSTLGQLRHTRNNLKLDLSKGEASLLDDCFGNNERNSKNSQVLDSGVGSSTSPFVLSKYGSNDPVIDNDANDNQNFSTGRSPH